jgi:tetratricopeptide (TPR) repeat protein
MKLPAALCLLVLAALLALSCGPGAESSRPAAGETKEALYQRGHALYRTMDFPAAEENLRRAIAMDSAYVDALVDLASLTYDQGVREEGEANPRRLERFRSSRALFARAEGLGYDDAAGYERLCELSVALGDERGFLKYARKSSERYPFDRQSYNLGLAYFGVGDWQGVVKSQKEASEKFKQSPYLGAFYRQLGRAYMKLDRDQTAERTFIAGVAAVDARLAALRTQAVGGRAEDTRRLTDDKIGMLLLLKRLHMTYKAAEKLEQVERQLRDAGYTKQP